MSIAKDVPSNSSVFSANAASNAYTAPMSLSMRCVDLCAVKQRSYTQGGSNDFRPSASCCPLLLGGGPYTVLPLHHLHVGGHLAQACLPVTHCTNNRTSYRDFTMASRVRSASCTPSCLVKTSPLVVTTLCVSIASSRACSTPSSSSRVARTCSAHNGKPQQQEKHRI